MHFKNSLSQLNPDNVLARGYALVQKADGTLVKSEAQLLIGDKISIALTVGKIKAEVTSLKWTMPNRKTHFILYLLLKSHNQNCIVVSIHE